MRVVVTGGTGFVGGWTAKAIVDAGHPVRFLSERELGITYRDPRETLADTVAGLRAAARGAA